MDSLKTKRGTSGRSLIPTRSARLRWATGESASSSTSSPTNNRTRLLPIRGSRYSSPGQLKADLRWRPRRMAIKLIQRAKLEKISPRPPTSSTRRCFPFDRCAKYINAQSWSGVTARGASDQTSRLTIGRFLQQGRCVGDLLAQQRVRRRLHYCSCALSRFDGAPATFRSRPDHEARRRASRYPGGPK